MLIYLVGFPDRLLHLIKEWWCSILPLLKLVHLNLISIYIGTVCSVNCERVCFPPHTTIPAALRKISECANIQLKTRKRKRCDPSAGGDKSRCVCFALSFYCSRSDSRRWLGRLLSFISTFQKNWNFRIKFARTKNTPQSALNGLAKSTT